MKFLIVIPTIRQGYPGFDEVIERVKASLTQPTDFRVLDGKSGKTQTLNQVLTEELPKSDAEVYITMDDDFVPTSGWQDALAEAFEKLPKYGALGLWLGDSQEMLDYMGSNFIESPGLIDGVRIRRVKPRHHVVGCMVAMRKDVAIAVGPTPTPETEKYQFWEDGWRGRRVTKLGYEQGFLDAGPVEIVAWRDTKEYLDQKQQDIEKSKERLGEYMKGVGDPLSVRLRNKISQIIRGK